MSARPARCSRASSRSSPSRASAASPPRARTDSSRAIWNHASGRASGSSPVGCASRSRRYSARAASVRPASACRRADSRSPRSGGVAGPSGRSGAGWKTAPRSVTANQARAGEPGSRSRATRRPSSPSGPPAVARPRRTSSIRTSSSRMRAASACTRPTAPCRASWSTTASSVSSRPISRARRTADGMTRNRARAVDANRRRLTGRFLARPDRRSGTSSSPPSILLIPRRGLTIYTARRGSSRTRGPSW